jgi:hypothetical protein
MKQIKSIKMCAWLMLIGTIATMFMLTHAVLAQVREGTFKVNPNANISAATIRVTSGELFLNRTASMNVETVNTNGVIIDRATILLTTPQLRAWMNSTNATADLKKFILNKLSTITDDTNAVVKELN